MSKILEADAEGKRRICKAMVDADTLQFGYIIPAVSFVPCYTEVRWLLSDPVSLHMIAEEMAKIVAQLDVDLLGGVELAGIPLVAAVSLVSGKPAVYVRKTPKAYGTGTAVMGKVQGKRAILIDDATGKGEGKSVFAGYLEEQGPRVTDMLVLYHTEHPLVRWFAEHDVTHHALITFADFAHYARDVGYISPELHDLMWDCYRGYNIERWAWRKEKFERTLALAEKEGFTIRNCDVGFEATMKKAGELGKLQVFPEGVSRDAFQEDELDIPPVK